METALRKMGNSTGLIVPAPLLRALGLSAGAAVDVVVVDGAIVARPVGKPVREGWDSAATVIGCEEPLDRDWLGAPLADDSDWEW